MSRSLSLCLSLAFYEKKILLSLSKETRKSHFLRNNRRVPLAFGVYLHKPTPFPSETSFWSFEDFPNAQKQEMKSDT